MIITCPECKKDVSNLATSCPNCGYPINLSQSTECDKNNETNELTVPGYVYFCKKCQEIYVVETIHGLIHSCSGKIKKTYITKEQWKELIQVTCYRDSSTLSNFIKEIISLYNTDKTEDEYEKECMAIYKKYKGTPIIIAKNTSSLKSVISVSCPYCHSGNTKKISTTSRMASTGLFGIGSSKIGKNYHCNNCGSNF